MKRTVLLLLLSIVTITINAQEVDPVLLTIGGKEVKLSEFNAIFNKNNSNENPTSESIQEYLDLYIKFKLKVREAEDLGYDTLPKFKNELNGYRKQLAQPYLTDKEVTEGLIKEAYDRMKFDIRASHILISLDSEADPADTLIAFNQALKARKRIVGGEDFAKVAKELSKDPSAKKNGGDLGYFSALHMVYPFETVAYSTKKGEVAMPVRTRFGYHVIRVIDRRPARGTIKVAHIMVKAEKKIPAIPESDKRKKIYEIYYKLITEGEDFGSLAKQFSDDKGSAPRGGELPEFNAGKMVEEFENTAFSLVNDGDVSEPVQTDFGWHIIKRISLEELGSYEDLYNVIKAKVSRDSRSNKSKEALLKKIKDDNNFVENIKERNDFYKLISEAEYLNGEFKAANTNDYNKLMFGLYARDGEKYEYTQIDFAQHIEKSRYKKGQKNKAVNMKAEINRHYNKIIEAKAIEFKDSRLSKTNKEFRLLMQEYRDGILLFDLTDEKVWTKAVKDTSGLEAYYENHKEKYMWGERVEAVMYICNSEEIAKNVAKILKKKEKKGYTNEDILKMINTDSQLALDIEEGNYSKGDNDFIDKSSWNSGSVSTIESRGSYAIVMIKNKLTAEPKKLSEIKGLFTSDYQNHLEKEWVEELKSKYKVELDEEVLKLVK